MVSPVSAIGETSVLVLDRTPGFFLNGDATTLNDFLRQKNFILQ